MCVRVCVYVYLDVYVQDVMFQWIHANVLKKKLLAFREKLSGSCERRSLQMEFQRKFLM